MTANTCNMDVRELGKRRARQVTAWIASLGVLSAVGAGLFAWNAIQGSSVGEVSTSSTSEGGSTSDGGSSATSSETDSGVSSSNSNSHDATSGGS